MCLFQDRDRLLAIIESAFGTFKEFNTRVRFALVAQSKMEQQAERKSSNKLSVADVVDIALQMNNYEERSSSKSDLRLSSHATAAPRDIANGIVTSVRRLRN